MPKTTNSEQLNEIRNSIAAMQQDVAAIKAMLEMHLRDGEHHFEPCMSMKQMQAKIMSSLTATVIALLTSAGSLIAQIFFR